MTLNLLGLVCSLIGGILLIYTLELKRSSFRLVETSNHDVAICLNEKKVASGYGGPLNVTDEPCPEATGPSAAAVIEAERPAFVPWGLGLMCLGLQTIISATMRAFDMDTTSALILPSARLLRQVTDVRGFLTQPIPLCFQKTKPSARISSREENYYCYGKHRFHTARQHHRQSQPE